MTFSTLYSGILFDHLSGKIWHVLDFIFTLYCEPNARAIIGLP